MCIRATEDPFVEALVALEHTRTTHGSINPNGMDASV